MVSRHFSITVDKGDANYIIHACLRKIHFLPVQHQLLKQIEKLR